MGIENITHNQIYRLQKAVAKIAYRHGLRNSAIKITGSSGGGVDEYGEVIIMGFDPALKVIVLMLDGCKANEEEISKKIADTTYNPIGGRVLTLAEATDIANKTISTLMGEGLAHEVRHLIDDEKHPLLSKVGGWLSTLHSKPTLRHRKWLRPILQLCYVCSPTEVRARMYARKYEPEYAQIWKSIFYSNPGN